MRIEGKEASPAGTRRRVHGPNAPGALTRRVMRWSLVCCVGIEPLRPSAYAISYHALACASAYAGLASAYAISYHALACARAHTHTPMYLTAIGDGRGVY